MKRKLSSLATAYELNEEFAAMCDHLFTWSRRIEKDAELRQAKATAAKQ